MKKIFAIIMTAVMAFSIVACSVPEADSQPESSQDISSENRQTQTDNDLLQLLEDRVNTTQPGTAGSGLKAVYAAKDILAWMKENMPEPEVLKATVKEFFENFEYKEEAMEAFDNISYIFDALADGKARDLLNSVGLSLEDFEISPEVKENIEKLIDEIKQYNSQQE